MIGPVRVLSIGLGAGPAGRHGSGKSAPGSLLRSGSASLKG